MASEQAQTLMKETGARVYWKGAEESAAVIAESREQFAELEAVIAK